MVQNDEDQWYPYEDSSGYDADVDVTYVGETIDEGVIASIAVGLNMQVYAIIFPDRNQSNFFFFSTYRSYSSPELSTQYAAVVASSSS
jgi:hypothetical protein